MKSLIPTFTIEPDSFEPEVEACFRAVDSVARELGIDYVVVGATARDLVMQSVLQAEVDFGLAQGLVRCLTPRINV